MGNLQTNWNDFFWLTGETPTSLCQLSEEIKENFEPFYHGPRSDTSLHDVVTSIPKDDNACFTIWNSCQLCPQNNS